MQKELKVMEFDKKQRLLEFVNSNSDKLTVLSISSTQVSVAFKHFLWYYEK